MTHFGDKDATNYAKLSGDSRTGDFSPSNANDVVRENIAVKKTRKHVEACQNTNRRHHKYSNGNEKDIKSLMKMLVEIMVLRKLLVFRKCS